MKEQVIHESFIDHTFYIFNMLGAIEFDKDRVDRHEQESKQYINQESLTKNLHKIFGV